MSRIMSAVASIFGGETSDLQTPAEWLRAAGGVTRTTSGENVTPERAMTVSAYFAAVRCISEDVGKLPFITYRRTAEGKERDQGHWAYRLLHDSPNPHMTAMSFRETLTGHALTRGNGYAEIARDGAGRPAELWPIHPSRVTVKRDTGTGRLVYEVRSEWGEPDPKGGTKERRVSGVVRLDQADVLHVHGLGGDGVCGWSVARFAAESLGLSIAAQKFGAAYFGNGTVIGGVLEHPGKLSPAAQKSLRESWGEMHQGADRANRPAILEEGMKWTALGVPPEEAQFLETRKFQVTEIARWFRIPPHKIQDLERATFTNIEQQGLEYVTDALMPWLVRWEQEAQRKLFAGDEGRFAEHLVTALLRGDMTARSTFYREMINTGIMTINEVRRAENLNAVEGGDTRLVNGTMKPVEAMIEEARRGETAEERKLRLEESIAEKKFKRELALKFAGDATIGDVMYNATDITKLMGELGLAKEEGYREPWLPVQGENKPLVTGELVRDLENDIIGGGIEKGTGGGGGEDSPQGNRGTEEEKTGEEEEGTGSQDSQDGQDQREEDGVTAAEANSVAFMLEATRPVLERTVARIKAKERKAVARAEKKFGMGGDGADAAGYAAWARDFYSELADQAIEDIGTFGRSVLRAVGVEEKEREVRVLACGLWLAGAGESAAPWAGVGEETERVMVETVMEYLNGGDGPIFTTQTQSHREE